MRPNEQHCTMEELYLLIDGGLNAETASQMRKHLRECLVCAGNYNSALKVHSVAKRLPLESASADLTQRVLSTLGIAPKSSFLFRLLEKSAYIFGLILVLGVMATVFILTGVVEMQQIQAGVSPAQKVFSQTGSAIAGGVGWFSQILKEYLPFAFSSATMAISVFTAIVVSMLAIADRFVGRKIVHRLR